MDVCDKKQSIIKDEWKLLNNSSVVKWTSRNIRTFHVLSLERKFIPSDMIWSGAIIMERWKCQVRSWGFIRVMNILESHMRNFNWNKKYDEKLLSLKIFICEGKSRNQWRQVSCRSDSEIVKKYCIDVWIRKQTDDLRWIHKREQNVPGNQKKGQSRKKEEEEAKARVASWRKRNRMGASSTGPKSNRETDENTNRQARMNLQDVENNNDHHIFVNPQDNLNFLPIHTLMDECDLLNNNTTLINNNYLTIAFTSSASSTTLATTLSRLSKKPALHQLSERHVQAANNNHEKMVKDNPKKKLTKEEKKKKKKEKPKTPRAPAGGAQSGGGKGREQEMMRRPRRKTDTKPEK